MLQLLSLDIQLKHISILYAAEYISIVRTTWSQLHTDVTAYSLNMLKNMNEYFVHQSSANTSATLLSFDVPRLTVG